MKNKFVHRNIFFLAFFHRFWLTILENLFFLQLENSSAFVANVILLANSNWGPTAHCHPLGRIPEAKEVGDKEKESLLKSYTILE